MKSFLFITLDTETGGLDPLVHSLLEVSLVFNELYLDDENLYKVKELSKLTIPIKESNINATKEALSVNNIDINRDGLDPLKASEVIINHLELLKFAYKNSYKFTILGHNPAFDIGFLGRLPRVNDKHPLDYFSHRVLDTSSIGKFLHLALDLNTDISKSNNLFDYFGLSKEQRHTSYMDCFYTAKTFECMLNMVRINSVDY